MVKLNFKGSNKGSIAMMKNIYLFCALLLGNWVSFLLGASPVSAQEKPTTLIESAYARATIPGTSISSAYMEIENKDNNTIALLNVTSPASPRIEIHQHRMNDGMMRMVKLNSIDIPPKERVKLQPSGLHLMLFDVKKPLKAQQQVELTLNFSNNTSVTIPVPVYSPAQERTSQETMSKMHEHHH